MYNPTIWIRFVFNAPSLDTPISIPFIRTERFTVEKFWAKIEQVLQSHHNICLDETNYKLCAFTNAPKRRAVKREEYSSYAINYPNLNPM